MRVVHCKKEPYTHYIGRPSPLGNKFSHMRGTKAEVVVATREEAIDCFEDDARNNPEILKLIQGLPPDAVLGCWCKPKACHGDVIIKLWKELQS